MNDLFKPCPFCGSRVEIWELFGRLVAGCGNAKCTMKPDTWLTAGEVFDVRSLAKHWNKRAKPPAAGKTLDTVPNGFKWELVPDYPKGEVVGACICGSWPGGECLKCPAVSAA